MISLFHTGPAVQAAACLRAKARSETVDRIDHRQDPGGRDRAELAIALREIGRVERTLFIVDWLLDADMQRRANTRLNKGEGHHALKDGLRICRQSEIHDRTIEGQHYRLAGLNRLAAIVISWNTFHLGEAIRQRQRDVLTVDPDILGHISPLGWAHILLTGEYRWLKRRKNGLRDSQTSVTAF